MSVRENCDRQRIIKQKGTTAMSRCSPHIEQRPGEAVTLPLTKSITLGEDCVYRMVGHVCARGDQRGK